MVVVERSLPGERRNGDARRGGKRQLAESTQTAVTIEQAWQALPQWVAECLDSAAAMAAALGADAEDYGSDPLTAFGAWQDYLDSLPLDEFEHSDWVTLKADVVAFVSSVLLRRFDCEWHIVADESEKRGYHYVIASASDDGLLRLLDLFGLVFHALDSGETQLLNLLTEALAQLGIPAILRAVGMHWAAGEIDPRSVVPTHS
ncbi:hypothetical protein [Nocardia huaxiensis]|uniref:hypothetical protein n=1 Tax=Nocardia huaxiensis TaxID=2755382 RepID=UPI001E3BC468|nr:hypothetical protein [Nocardia huaxiensis]UFS99221.1 hypothetical protein LPY97_15675 [Nocardia huaxiensis]